MALKTKPYYIHKARPTDHFALVDGVPLVFPGFEEFEFFIHKIGPAQWVVTEATTGACILPTGIAGYRNKKDALNRFGEYLQAQSKSFIRFTIAYLITEHGAVPTD